MDIRPAEIAAILKQQIENFGTDAGLGYLVWRSWQVFEVTDMYVGLMMIALLGYLFQLAMGRLERRLLRWRPAATAMKGTP